jgi:hypothetical protein
MRTVMALRPVPSSLVKLRKTWVSAVSTIPSAAMLSSMHLTTSAAALASKPSTSLHMAATYCFQGCLFIRPSLEEGPGGACPGPCGRGGTAHSLEDSPEPLRVTMARSISIGCAVRAAQEALTRHCDGRYVVPVANVGDDQGDVRRTARPQRSRQPAQFIEASALEPTG